FPIAEAQLTALFMQSVVYGIHIVTFTVCMYAWSGRHPVLHTSNCLPWMMVTIALFIISTIDVCFNFYHNLIAFIFFMGPSGANGKFKDFLNWVNVMWIYQCWMVYKQQLIVLIPPLLLWTAAAVCGSIELYYMFKLKEATTIPSLRALPAILLVYIQRRQAGVIRIMVAEMIAHHIWSMQKPSSDFIFQKSWRGTGNVKLSHVNKIFIESALLYTLLVIACLVTELSNTNGNYGVSDISMELAGISFDLIIICIWSGVSTEAEPASA
ncbi:hypothetical protein DAEQUDRAFT_654769, partial [Daedalea quercina L-15889]